jgi:hypothetical protein
MQDMELVKCMSEQSFVKEISPSHLCVMLTTVSLRYLKGDSGLLLTDTTLSKCRNNGHSLCHLNFKALVRGRTAAMAALNSLRLAG